ncbi:DUF3311 domain-containing protein [Aeoliella sp. SH292]|jgi:hypothetical protein|uniref:DUF3311 domain-containing protein n=1 Tax=Aeoliella sp. SH292 TaxID=3454464 RepID=UPI003F991089
MKYVVWLLVVVLVVLHQDFWWWDDPYLVFGFLPIGFFSQICISVAVAVVWWLATFFCWPADIEADKGGPQQ